MMMKTTAALMTFDICINIGIFHCFSAHVHTILCYDVISVKAQLCMLHVLLCDVISRGISISYNAAARVLTDIYARCLRASAYISGKSRARLCYNIYISLY